MDCVACQDPLSMDFPGQDYWGGFHFLLQGIFPTQELNLHLRVAYITVDSFTTELLGKPIIAPSVFICV